MIHILFSDSASEPDSGSDLHIVRAVFGTPFWPKSSRNDRFYKGLAPKGGWDLGPAGRPPAGQPGPAKRSFLGSSMTRNTFLIQNTFPFNTFLIQIRAARKQSKKLIAKKVFGPKSRFECKHFFTFSAPGKSKSLFPNALYAFTCAIVASAALFRFAASSGGKHHRPTRRHE